MRQRPGPLCALVRHEASHATEDTLHGRKVVSNWSDDRFRGPPRNNPAMLTGHGETSRPKNCRGDDASIRNATRLLPIGQCASVTIGLAAVAGIGAFETQSADAAGSRRRARRRLPGGVADAVAGFKCDRPDGMDRTAAGCRVDRLERETGRLHGGVHDLGIAPSGRRNAAARDAVRGPPGRGRRGDRDGTNIARRHRSRMVHRRRRRGRVHVDHGRFARAVEASPLCAPAVLVSQLWRRSDATQHHDRWAGSAESSRRTTGTPVDGTTFALARC
jgi:hypothetical protein